MMAVNTKIDYRAREYANAAENIANARALRKQWFSPQGKPPAADSAKPVERMVEQPRQGAKAMPMPAVCIERETPKDFLRRRCREIGIPYLDIIGKGRPKTYVEPRHKLMLEVYETFDLSLPQMGKLFGGRDHTTLIAALRKQGVEKTARPNLNSHIHEIRAMWLAGESKGAIARAFGVTQPSIVHFCKRHGWTR